MFVHEFSVYRYIHMHTYIHSMYICVLFCGKCSERKGDSSICNCSSAYVCVRVYLWNKKFDMFIPSLNVYCTR